MEPQKKISFPPFVAPMLLASGVIFLLIGLYFMYTTHVGDYTVVRNSLFLCGAFDMILAAILFVWQRRQKENL